MSGELEMIVECINMLDQTDPRMEIPAIQAERRLLVRMAAKIVRITHALPSGEESLMK